MNKNVSLCTIIKNSEDTLDIFFPWAINNFEEVCVVVDPENYDDTLDSCLYWAGEGNVKVIQCPFDNFSAQWKRSFDLATKDWIFYIGADEILSPVDLDKCAEALKRLNKKVGVFPRYNLQKSLFTALEMGYPDHQWRLFNRLNGVTMDGNAVDESLNCRDSYMEFPQHIIHLGHIRPVNALIQKGIDRSRFKDVDACDGPGLKAYGDKWFVERNKNFERFTFNIPDQETIDQIIKYIPGDFIEAQ